MILTLGGPLASATLGAIGNRSALLLVPGPAWPAALGRVVALGTGFAFGDFLFNLLPMASEAAIFRWRAAVANDTGAAPGAIFIAPIIIWGFVAQPRRFARAIGPRRWWNAPVSSPRSYPTPPDHIAMAYAHFLDRGDWQRALTWLEKAHQAARPGSKLAQALTDDSRVHCEAFYRRDSREAQRWFAQAPQRDDSADYWRSTATVRAAQGECGGRIRGLGQGLGNRPRSCPATGVYDMDREQLRTGWRVVGRAAGPADVGVNRNSDPTR